MEKPENEYTGPSKSQLKREVTALQKMGEALVALAESELKTIPLDPTLAEAVAAARKMKTREAKRRQLQYIGRLMCEVDVKPIQEALNRVKYIHHQTNQQFHEVEQWRDKLILKGDEALQEFMQSFPAADRQQLRQLIRKIKQDKSNDKNSGAMTELFRYLRIFLS